MPEPELPISLTPSAEATDQQIAVYMIELCEELLAAIGDPRFRPEPQDAEKLRRLIEDVRAGTRQHAGDLAPPYS